MIFICSFNVIDFQVLVDLRQFEALGFELMSAIAVSVVPRMALLLLSLLGKSLLLISFPSVVRRPLSRQVGSMQMCGGKGVSNVSIHTQSLFFLQFESVLECNYFSSLSQCPWGKGFHPEDMFCSWSSCLDTWCLPG